MKKTSIFILIIALALFTTSCSSVMGIKPSGEITTEQKSVSGFSSLDVSSAISVHVRFSDTEEKVSIEANENLHQYIEVEKVGNELEIGLKNNTNIRGNAVIRVYITTKHLNSYGASGASSIFINDQIVNNNLTIDLSGASTFDADLNIQNLNMDLSGASTAKLSGHANNFSAEASGASTLKDYNLAINNLDIDLSGASNASLSVSNTLKLEASGASILNYKGSCSIEKLDLSGASQIKKKG